MNTRRNILFSTTRQWNPGDEFILMGILQVLTSINPDFNAVIYNRNPEIYHRGPRPCFNLQIDPGRLRFKRLKNGRYDNSFKDNFLDDAFIDCAIFAGTPEWGSDRLWPMYEYIHRHSIPVIYLGIGIGQHDFDLESLPALYRDVLHKALLVTVRDAGAQTLFSRFRPVLVPCPALVAAPRQYHRKIGSVRRIGLIYSRDTAVKCNRLDAARAGLIGQLYREFLTRYGQKFECEFICHYIDELKDFEHDFKGMPCRYSYDAREYIGIYNRYDLVIGPRVHGIGLAASMGIPGIYVRHDARADTCRGFCAEMFEPDSGIEALSKLVDDKVTQISADNGTIIAHKDSVFTQYRTLLEPIIKGL